MRLLRTLLLSLLGLWPVSAALAQADPQAASSSPLTVTNTDLTPATGAPVLRFAQITDAHLFDAGYRCSGTYVEREYQENLHALAWSVAQINDRWKAGDHISFLVFTGDLGIANLASAGVPAEQKDPGKESACKDDDAPGKIVGPVSQQSFDQGAALLGHILDDLPEGVPVYFVPGNNDLDDEDLASMPKRYTLFVDTLARSTHHKVADLLRAPASAGAFTLLGLNSAGFKPQSYDMIAAADSASQCGGTHCDESTQAVPGTQEVLHAPKPADGSAPLVYCTDLLATGSGPRAAEKIAAMDALASQISSGPTLIFTHEPDLQDPYPARRINAAKGCAYRSTWLLPAPARSTWQNRILANKDVLGIFAGHFHSSDLAQYGGPKFNDALTLPASTPAAYTAPIFVAMPLAVRLQWPSYPLSARGMSFYTVRGRTVSPELELFPAASYAGGDRSHSRPVAEALMILHAHPDLAFLLAALLTLALILILLWMASSLDPRCDLPAPSSNLYQRAWHWLVATFNCCLNQLGKLIYEGDTQSYSLSKLQFLLWTVATVYGYTYLWVAHTWVQGLPGLPDITGSFPWETLLAGGTAVAAQVSRQIVGTKGGGPLRPHLSDLIAAGGVVASGRVQFLSWTLVAITAYISSILASDPTTIHLLPEIPTRLLEISGISAGAYLAARSVSTGGPVITSALLRPPSKPATPPAPNEPEIIDEILVVGNYLSNNATLHAFQPRAATTGDSSRLLPATTGSPSTPPVTGLTSDAISGIDGVPVEGFKYLPPPFNTDGATAVTGTTDLYPRLLVKLTALPDGSKWSPPSKWTLRVQNPDGKYAEVQVALDALPPPAPTEEPPLDPVDPTLSASGTDSANAPTASGKTTPPPGPDKPSAQVADSAIAPGSTASRSTESSVQDQQDPGS